MSEIGRSAEEQAPRARRRIVWLVAAPIAVAAVAATALLLPGHPDARPAPVAPALTGSPTPASSASATPEPEPTDAAGLLVRAAKAIAAKPDPGAKGTQFIYTKEIHDGGGRPRTERKIWWSVDGRHEGAMVDPTLGTGGPMVDGRHVIPPQLHGNQGFVEPGMGGSRMTYEFVASLPTDPEKLAQLLLDVDRTHEVTAEIKLTDKDRRRFAFGDVQQIFQNVSAPPAVAGALMQAATRIPGTSVVTDQVDAAGRKGVAVVGMSNNQRIALIFDVKTGEYLGLRIVESKYLPAVGPDGKPPVGEPTAEQTKADPWAVFTVAAMETKIVDKAGDE